MHKRVWMGLLVTSACCLFTPVAMGIEPPDTDGDGVSDVSDQCVGDPGHVDSPFGSGCPCSADGVSDADCDGIPDAEDENPDYGSGDYGGSSGGGTDTDGDGIPDSTDPTPYGESSNGGSDNGNGDGGTSSGGTNNGGTNSGGGTSGTGSGTGTGMIGTFTPYDWRQKCIDTGGTWRGSWCAYAGEVKGDCYIDHVYLPDKDPANGPGEKLKPDTVRDQCRYYRGRWYPYE